VISAGTIPLNATDISPARWWGRYGDQFWSVRSISAQCWPSLAKGPPCKPAAN